MPFRIHVDDRAVQAALKQLRRQLPFAISRGLNRTGLAVQEAQRAKQRQVFTVRRPSFIDRAVKFRKATKTKLVAEVLIDPPGGQARAHVLTQHEDGGTKRPRDGGRSIAIPVEARRNKRDLITASQRPKAFAFEQQGRSPRVKRGNRGTVLIRSSNGEGVILQQRRGRPKAVLLYRLRERVQLRPRLAFRRTAEGVVRQRLVKDLGDSLREALRKAR